MLSCLLLPAILIAGPPHSGKSVLSFLLTWKLREMGVSHYLLRAAPDGEGDWYHLGKSGLVRSLRQEHKGDYTSKFVTTIRTIIDNRLLPLLVDVGGRPRGEQFGILKACTHAILLYRTNDDLAIWRAYLTEMDLIPIAELHSQLQADETIIEAYPLLRGVISGLDRHNWKMGITFGALLDRIAGICHYDESHLEQIHAQKAPYPVLSERQIARALDLNQQGKRLIWEPAHLTFIQKILHIKGPLAIYGRGPVWLAGMLAAHLVPVPMALFDARYGWLILPEVICKKPANVNINCSYDRHASAIWLSCELMDTEVEPEKICLPYLEIDKDEGLVISGELPRWYFAALTRKFAKQSAWIAIDDPANNRAIVVDSRLDTLSVGSTIERKDG